MPLQAFAAAVASSRRQQGKPQRRLGHPSSLELRFHAISCRSRKYYWPVSSARSTYLETSRAEQFLSKVLIDVTVRVIGAAEPILFIASELLAIVGDSEPVTSTRCPR
jgi:hypothetical protein